MNLLAVSVAEIYAARLEWLQAELKRTGLKQAAVAHAAGMNTGTLTFLKQGKVKLLDRHWTALRAAFQQLTAA